MAENEKGKRNTHFNAPDREHAGVAIVIKNKLLKFAKLVQPINGRHVYLVLNAQGGYIAFHAKSTKKRNSMTTSH